MKCVRLTSVTSMVVFGLLALQLQLTAHELQKDSVANWINDRDGIQVVGTTSAGQAIILRTLVTSSVPNPREILEF
jgi:hypothetical protein